MIDVLTTPWERAIRLETRVAQIIREQEIHGWLIDKALLEYNMGQLDVMIEAIENDIYKQLPLRKVVPPSATIDAPYRRDGQIKERVKAYGLEVCGPFSKVWWERINLDSEDQVKKYLLSVGWQPTEWNINKDTYERTSPKLTEDSFETMEDKVGQLICKRLTIVHRRRQLQGFLEVIRPRGVLWQRNA